MTIQHVETSSVIPDELFPKPSGKHIVTGFADTVETQYQRRLRWLAKHSDELAQIIDELNQWGEFTFTYAGDYQPHLDIRFTGDKRLFKRVYTNLLMRGCGEGVKPTAGSDSYSSFMCRHEDNFYVWISFSSTECKRVQVGVKMVEQPVYELQCGTNDGDIVLPTPPEQLE